MIDMATACSDIETVDYTGNFLSRGHGRDPIMIHTHYA